MSQFRAKNDHFTACHSHKFFALWLHTWYNECDLEKNLEFVYQYVDEEDGAFKASKFELRELFLSINWSPIGPPGNWSIFTQQ